MESKDFTPGDLIRFIPMHANGNKEHPDCEDGIVTSVTCTTVFCRFVFNASFGKSAGRWRTIANSEACHPKDLIKIVPHQEWKQDGGLT